VRERDPDIPTSRSYPYFTICGAWPQLEKDCLLTNTQRLLVNCGRATVTYGEAQGKLKHPRSKTVFPESGTALAGATHLSKRQVLSRDGEDPFVFLFFKPTLIYYIPIILSLHQKPKAAGCPRWLIGDSK